MIRTGPHTLCNVIRAGHNQIGAGAKNFRACGNIEMLAMSNALNKLPASVLVPKQNAF